MNLELKHVVTYLLHGLHILVDGVSCEVEGIDLMHKDTLIAERVNYRLCDVKLILRPFEDWKTIEEISDRVTSEQEEDFEGLDAEGILDVFDGLPGYVKEFFYKHKIDIFSLLKDDLAVSPDSKKILY